jgi:cytochrome c5
VALIVAIAMIANFAVDSYANRSLKGDPAMSDAAVAKRLQRVGELVVVDASAPKVSKSAEEVYNGVCAACHASGVLNAPKLGDKGAWASRITLGYETLVKHAVSGINQMPPKGGATDLSDIEVARTVAYMANSAGAKFSPPQEAPPSKTAQSAAAPAQPAAQSATPAAPAGQTPAAPTQPAAAADKQVASAKADPAKGKSVYDSLCQACHAAGIAGAPKAGDKALWAPRIAQGVPALYESALKGKGAMPPKGGNTALPDDDVKAAVDYLISMAK